MYKGIKSCIFTNDGTRIFPMLHRGTSRRKFVFDNVCEMAMYFVCLLYADDTALIATNASDLQHSLDVFFQYCNKWKLKINANKTNIIILMVMEIIIKRILP